MLTSLEPQRQHRRICYTVLISLIFYPFAFGKESLKAKLTDCYFTAQKRFI